MDQTTNPKPSAWKSLSHTTLLETRIFGVRSTRFRHPVRLVERDFIVIDPPDWVNVIAVTTDERMVLVRQFRYGADAFSLEIPGGVIERGEEPAIAGVRELQEETGYTGDPARILGSAQPNPAIQSNRCHFVWVERAVATMPFAWDHDEEIEVCVLPVEEVFTLARNGGITHSLTWNALFLFEPFWRRTRK
jgi:ADP-ribose pyrophosphatase